MRPASADEATSSGSEVVQETGPSGLHRGRLGPPPGPGLDPYLGIHGWGGSHLAFVPLAPYVPAGAVLVAPDLPGYGASPALPRIDEASLTAPLVAELRALRSACPDRPLTVVGNCSGAILALLAAEAAPGLLDRLLLIDPFAFAPWYFRTFAHPVIGRYAYRSTFGNPLGRWLTNGALAGKRTGEAHLTRSFTTVESRTALGYMQVLVATGGPERFAPLGDGDGPTIEIAHGERTFAAVKESVARWKAVWPRATSREVPGSGHLPLQEATEELAGWIFRREGR